MTWPMFDFSSAPPFQQILDYQGGTAVIYIGWATPGVATGEAKWKIRRLTYDGNGSTTQIQYMNGDVGFHQIWDNRVTTDGVATNYS